MISNRKILFFINPKAGMRYKRNVSDIIENSFDKNYEIVSGIYSDNETDEIIKNALAENYNVIAVIGGDGTVNKVAKHLVNTETTLAIIPTGSGNGLARHLEIPLNTRKALELINKGRIISIDTCTANDKPFFCISGIGFDAHVAHLFAKSKQRGLVNYTRIAMQEILQYRSSEYILTIDGNTVKTKAFLISFANAGQYGNNVVIAPEADIRDGIINVTIVKSFSVDKLPDVILRLYNKTLDNSVYAETYKARHIIIENSHGKFFHYDGEPYLTDGKIEINIIPKSLNVIVK